VVTALIWLPIAILVACSMEFWAGFLHEHFWHGVLWRVHRSHHRKRRGRFEANDALSALHAPIAVAFILYGCQGAQGALREVIFGVGIGMSLFGAAYFVMHDGLAHGRLPVQFIARVPLFARLRDAHRAHHGKGSAVPFGFFLGPQEIRRSRRISSPRVASPARGPDPSARPPLGRAV
jgi:beta-carotene 3-hydroxylase